MAESLQPHAPISQLLSISSSPLVTTMTDEQLAELVTRLRKAATSPATLSSELSSESATRKPRALSAKAQLLADL